MDEIKVLREPSIDTLQNENPLTTIIIGGDIKLFKECGFYYSFVSAEDEFLENFIDLIKSNGVKETYEEYKALYNQDCIKHCKDSYGGTIDTIYALLTAFNNYDYDTVKTLLEVRLDDLINSIGNLKNIVETSDEDSTFELKFINTKKAYKELYDEYDKVTKELNELNNAENRTTDYYLLKDRYKELEEKNADLMIKISESTRQNNNTVSKKEYDDLTEKFTNAELMISELNKKLKEKETKKILQTEFFSGDDENDQGTFANESELITILRKKLDEAQRKESKPIEDCLPVITDSTPLKVKYSDVFFLKVINQSPMYKSFVNWLAIASHSHNNKDSSNSCIVLIYDRLSGINKTMYKNVKIPTYSIYDENHDDFEFESIVATNDLSQDFLRNVIGISAYSCVIVVDNLMSNKWAVNISNCRTYFLIDSEDSISSYSLDAKKCILFSGDTAGNTKCAYTVDAAGFYEKKSDKDRLLYFVHDTDIRDIFKGVLC